MSFQDNHEQQGHTAPGASAGYDPATGMPYDPGAMPPPPYGYPPPGTHIPNPMLAGLLGFVPGVGAMYNGQFAKGLAHIAIFAMFISLSNHVSDMFGLFIAGWIFYMVFEAYQTAAARRDGRPLPDPFGLNHIGDRFGFHSQHHPDLNRAYSQTVGRMPGAAPAMEQAHYDAATGSTYYTKTDGTGTSSYHVDPAGNVYGGHTSAPPPPASPYGAAYHPPYDPAAYGMPPAPPPPPGYGYGVPPIPPVPPAGHGNSLPAGAIWLIGLGVFALLGSLRPFAFLQGEATGGLFLMALAAFLYFRRYMSLREIYPEGSPALQWNSIAGYRGASFLGMIGLLVFLQGVHAISSRSFGPIFLIGFGAIMLLSRLGQNRMMPEYPVYPGYPAPPVTPFVQETPVNKDEPLSIVPRYTRPENDLGRNDEEGR